MEYIIVIVISLVILLLLKSIFKINIKKLKQEIKDDKLDKIVKKLPNNIEIAKNILGILGNNKTKIVQTDENTTLYTVINDTITISKNENNYTRVQTMAHECLHSVQDKLILLFNFIFSNIYYLYFFEIILLTIFKVIQNGLLQIYILAILGFIYFFVRNYLELEAMLKAKDLAKQYIENKNILEKEQVDLLINKYESINKIGIKAQVYSLFLNCNLKLIIYSLICLLLKI